MINIENIVLQNIRVDKKLFKDIITYYIRYGAVDGVKTCDFFLHKTIAITEKGGYIDDDDKCIESTEDGENNILNTTTEFYWYKNRHIKKQ